MELAEQASVPASVGAMVASHASAEAWSWAAWALRRSRRRPPLRRRLLRRRLGRPLAAPRSAASPCSRPPRRSAAAAFGELALPRLDGAGSVALLAAVGLVTWVGVSIVWSIAGDRSWSALAKGLVYLAFLVLGLALAASLRGAARARRGGDAGAGPRLRRSDGRCSGERCRASSRTAVASPGCASRSATGTRSHCSPARRCRWACGSSPPYSRRAIRAAGGLLVYGAVLVLMLTQSRAGLLALVVGVATWLLLSRARLEGGLLGLCAAVPALAVAGWAFTRPALVEDGALRADRVDDGAAVRRPGRRRRRGSGSASCSGSPPSGSSRATGGGSPARSSVRPLAVVACA